MKSAGLIWIILVAAVFAEEIRIENAQQLRDAAKRARPGDAIILKDGVWRNANLKITLTGSKSAPIGLRAETVGGVSFEGTSSLELIGEHVVVDGLVFQNGSVDGGHVIKIRGKHNRVMRCEIREYNPENSTTRYHWISLQGFHHRVDHCRFFGQNHSGATLAVWLDEDGDGSHRIDHNHFGPRPPGDDNGFETIRIGDSKTSMRTANCSVVANLFERCDGEIEIISNKSCGNTYLANTIIESLGGLTLRHGNDCLVAFNTIDGGKRKESGGIRVVGEGHEVRGNVIENVGRRIDAAIALSAGVPNAKLHEHARVRNVKIVENTIRNNLSPIFVFDHGIGSHGREQLPELIEIRGNRFDTTLEKAQGKLGEKVATWTGNSGHDLQLPYRLSKHDVGPKSWIDPHPDAVPNSHAAGKVDDFTKVPFIVPSPKSLTGIVIDETEAKLVGDWQYSTHTPPYVGIGYLHDRKNGKGEKSVTYRFDPPKSGIYRVELSHCSNVRRSTNTPVTIRHAGGEETIRINQQEFAPIRNLFRPLGEFEFKADEEAWVRISNDGTEGKYVIADSIRFSLIS
ncbi:MAG: chondroitinase-B domain-containing protein, partial [Verrucomicrobiota bacterium]